MKSGSSFKGNLLNMVRLSFNRSCFFVFATPVFTGCGKTVIGLNTNSVNSAESSLNLVPNTNCRRIGWELHCDISEGTVDIGDGQATAVRLFNRTGKTLKLEKIEVPWFAGSPTGCFAEFGISRNELHMGQPNTPYVGEFAFSPKMAHESTIPALQLSNGKSFRIDPDDKLTILSNNGCYKNPNPTAPTETPMTFRVTVSRMTSSTLCAIEA